MAEAPAVRSTNLTRRSGGMRERTNRHAWRACVGQPTVGSNPTPSAMCPKPTLGGGGDALDDATAMGLALAEARAAVEHDDVPVGAVIVRDGRVLARRHNERERLRDPTAHAELLALREAAAALGTWRLEGCTLVVTLEPCVMCAGALLAARIGRLVFGAADLKAGATGSLY